MEAGGIRTRNHPLKGEATPAAASAALYRPVHEQASVQDKGRQGALPLRAPPVASHRSGPRSNPTCSPGRRNHSEKRRETRGGKGPLPTRPCGRAPAGQQDSVARHLRTLASALPLLSGNGGSETKYPYLTASRRRPSAPVRSLETRAGKAPTHLVSVSFKGERSNPTFSLEAPRAL